MTYTRNSIGSVSSLVHTLFNQSAFSARSWGQERIISGTEKGSLVVAVRLVPWLVCITCSELTHLALVLYWLLCISSGLGLSIEWKRETAFALL